MLTRELIYINISIRYILIYMNMYIKKKNQDSYSVSKQNAVTDANFWKNAAYLSGIAYTASVIFYLLFCFSLTWDFNFNLKAPPKKVNFHQLDGREERTMRDLKMDAADSLKKSNMLQSPFILGEGRDSLKGTERGSVGRGMGGWQAAIKTAPGFILAKNFAFPSANRGLEPGIAARPHRGRLLGGGSGRRRRREKPQRGEEKKKMAQRLSPDRRHGDFPAWNRGLKGTPE